MLRVLLAVLTIAVTVYAVIDCARTPSDQMPKGLPKPLIILLVLLIAPLGGIGWIVISRISRAEKNGKGLEITLWSSDEASNVFKPRPAASAHPGPLAPDDDPEFLFKLDREIHRAKSEEAKKPPLEPKVEMYPPPMPVDDSTFEPRKGTGNSSPGRTQPRGDQVKGNEDTSDGGTKGGSNPDTK